MLVKLGTVLKVQHGYAFKSENYVKKSPYRLVTLGNFSENNTFKYNNPKAIYYGANFPKEFILQENDLILPLTEQVEGLFGNTALVPCSTNYKFVLNQRVGKIICNESKVDKLYLHYLLASESVKKQLEARASGTRQRNISPENIYDVTVDLPNIELQIKIGLILKKIENQIESNNTIVKRLQVLAHTIYTRYFLQFEFLNKDGKPYKSYGGKMVWDEKLKQEVPEGWQTKSLKDCCKIVLGGTPKTDETKYWNGDINWLNSGEMANFPIINSELKITTLGMNNSATTFMKKGTTVVSITGNLRASILAIDSCANQSVVGILENSKFKSAYIYPFIKNMIITFSKISTGNCQQHINKATIENAILLIPSEKVLKEYYEKVNKIYMCIFKNSFENQKLISLRNVLLPLLINGQLK